MKQVFETTLYLALVAAATALVTPELGQSRSTKFMRGVHPSRSQFHEDPEKDAPKEAHHQAAEKALGEHKKSNKVYKDATKDHHEHVKGAIDKHKKQAEGAIEQHKEQVSQNGTNPILEAADAVGDAIADAVEGIPNGLSDTKAEEAEENEVPSVPGCKNSPKGWADAKGNNCEDYAEGEWCTQHGGYGDGWLDEWGSFDNVTKKGKTAKQVCCVCGGGYREDQRPATSPAPAGAGAPGIAGPILGTKQGRALQAQGYSGDFVIHEDANTMTEDWGREFGPHAGHRDIKVICQEHPGNEWCSLHGYYGYGERSGVPLLRTTAAFVSLLLACL